MLFVNKLTTVGTEFAIEWEHEWICTNLAGYARGSKMAKCIFTRKIANFKAVGA